MLNIQFKTSLRFLIFTSFLIFSFIDLKSQSVFHVWPTIDLQGEVFDDVEVKFEYRNKYDITSDESKQGRIDLGFAYKINKLKIGIYYREIYDLKNDVRVSELRPHLDITYKINDYSNIRLRNEYRLREIDNNIFRYRLRYSYSLKSFKNFNPFIQNEFFFSENSFVRNRINMGLNIKLHDSPISIKPSYILESNRKVTFENIDWSTKNIFVVALSIKL